MKNSNWLDITEYLLLVGSGVGSVAAIASQQVAFTAAPFSLLMAVNLVNRRRLDLAGQAEVTANLHQLEQQLSQRLVTLDRQVQEQPSYSDLKGMRQRIQDQQTIALTEIEQTVGQRFTTLESRDWGQMQSDLRQLRGEQAQLQQSVTGIAAQLKRLAPTRRLDEATGAIAQLKLEIGDLRKILSEMPPPQKEQSPRALQDQINHLNRRLNQLPPPFNANSLKQEMAGLIKMMGDLVSRRELAKMIAEVEKIRQQHQAIEQTAAPLRTVNTIRHKQTDTLSTLACQKDDGMTEGGGATAELSLLPKGGSNWHQVAIALENRLYQLDQGEDVTQFQAEIDRITTHLANLQTQLSSVEHHTQALTQQQKNLGDWVRRLPQILDGSALQNQIKHLTARTGLSEQHLADLQTQIVALLAGQTSAAASEAEVADQLVFDLPSASGRATSAGGHSRALIETALNMARSSLVLVLPYPDQTVLDENLLAQFQGFLQRGGTLNLGWGHLEHLQHYQQPRYIYQNQLQRQPRGGELSALLSQLTDLKRQYPQQFRFKVLGTDENFLVCDDTYALLGIQPIPTASAVFSQVAVGLRTTRSEVIHQLIDRFHEPALAIDDAVSYFNRAITRYELGDKSGAIADYTEVLRIASNHDISYNNRALVHYELGNYQAAIADFERALLANPRNAIAYCNRGIVRGELSNRLGAIADYTDAIQIDGDCWPAYFQRGLARNRVGNQVGAIADFGEVMRVHPQDASACFYRGLAKTKLGDRIGAIRDLKAAAGLFSAQGHQIGQQQATDAITKLRKHALITGNAQEKRA